MIGKALMKRVPSCSLSCSKSLSSVFSGTFLRVGEEGSSSNFERMRDQTNLVHYSEIHWIAWQT